VGRLRVSTAWFRAGTRIDSHYHERACLSVIVEGYFQQRFPGAAYDCPAGGVLVKPPGERHVDRWGDRATRHVMIEPLVVDDTLGPARPIFERVSYRLDPGFASLATRIIRELAGSDDLVPLAVEALAADLIVRVGRGPRVPAPGSNPPAWLRRVRETLQDRYAETPVLARLAADAGVHPSRLSHEFRRYYGTSPSSYLRGVRLARARSDLEAGRLGLAEIAARHGFSDQSHLTRELKRATGWTPAAYRRMHRA
jgi:AraC-like DNA-binding protein